jgi:hypothetical protein
MKDIKESLRMQHIIRDNKWKKTNQKIYIEFNSGTKHTVCEGFKLPIKGAIIKKEEEFKIHFPNYPERSTKETEGKPGCPALRGGTMLTGIVLNRGWDKIYNTYQPHGHKIDLNAKIKETKGGVRAYSATRLKGLEISIKGRIKGAAKARRESTGLWGTLNPQTYLGTYYYNIYQKHIYTKWGAFGLTIRNTEGF